MANLSDAFGTIIVTKVEKEFLEYARIAAKNYYDLADESDLEDIEPAEDLTISFSTSGRWTFESNLENYLSPDGHWHTEDPERLAYDELRKAIEQTNGSVVYDYKDSDTANNWLGHGTAWLQKVDNEVVFNQEFEDEESTLENFMKHAEYTEDEAIDYMYGNEVLSDWHKYVKDNPEHEKFEKWYENYDYRTTVVR